MPNERLGQEPHDLMTRLAYDIGENAGHAGLVPEGVRLVVMLVDGETDKAGVGAFNYQGDTEEEAARNVIVDLLLHLKAMFAAMGQEMDVIPVRKS